MDVTCERCGTEYEFDETLLSGRGTSVKCTNCGHVFKVYPKAQKEADRTTSHWRLRTGDDTVETIESLRELQRRIVSGELSPSDQIARGEQPWKPLGSIPELETFFRAAPHGASPETQVEAGREPRSEGVVADPFASQSARPPGSDRPVRNKTLLGVVPIPSQPPYASPSESPGFRQPSVPPANTNEGVARAEQPEPAAPRHAEPQDAPQESRRAARGTRLGYAAPTDRGIEDAEYEESATQPAPTSAPLPYYDDEELPSLPSRSWTWKRWLGIGLLLLLVAGLASRWQEIGAWVGLLPDPATVQQAIDAGDAAMAEDHLAAYERAIGAYRQVADGPTRNPALDVRLARAYALATDSLAGSAAEQQDPVRAQQYAGRALDYANDALTAEPDDLAAAIARADALRLMGLLSESEDQLASARKMPFFRTAEYFRVRALLQAAQAEGKLSAGYKSAEKAQEADPDGIRYRLLRARTAMDAGDDVEARDQLEAVLRAQPLHPVASSLLEALEAREAAAAAAALQEPEDLLDAEGTEPSEGPATEEAEQAETAPSEEAAQEPQPAEAAKKQPATAPKTKTPSDRAAAEAAAEPKPEPQAKTEPEETNEATKPERKASPAEPRSDLAYDEYDKPSDESVNGRPPARDYNWHMRQARVYLARGDYNGARAQFESALERRPGSPDPTDGLGEVAMSAGDPALALRYFRSAAQRGHQDAFFKLGTAYERLGRDEQALSAYYTYLETHPSGRYAPTAKAAIRRLESKASP